MAYGELQIKMFTSTDKWLVENGKWQTANEKRQIDILTSANSKQRMANGEYGGLPALDHGKQQMVNSK